MLRILAGLAGLTLVSLPHAPKIHTPAREAKMFQVANRFLDSLDEPLKTKATYAFNSDERLSWHYVPIARNGVPMKELSEAQQKAAQDLLRTGLSVRGLEKVTQIRELENVLKEIEKGTGPVRDPDLYFVTIFGQPSEKGSWGWRFEGHHMSLNWTVLNGKVIASSPQFLGTNPGEVRSGPLKGRRVLAKEEDLGYDMIHALTDEQRKVAILSPTAPSEIITASKRQADILEHKGVAYNDMTKEQQGILLTLIREYAIVQNPAIARERLEAVRKAGLDKIVFAWMGGTERGTGNYYRVQGSTFLIEYDNTQNNNNHVHSVWRDFKGDFGVDLLAQHYQSFAHRGGQHFLHDHDHDESDHQH